jgi:thiol-disulfide isomerase/thioredoxin
MAKLSWALVVFSTMAWAQRCDPPAPTAKLLQTLPDNFSNRRKLLEEMLKTRPGDFWLNRALVDGAVYQRAAIREKYRVRYETDPSTENQYLYGRSLVGFDTKQALQIYSAILSQEADNPWVHSSQLEIYRSEAFRDRTKLLASFDAVTRACPSWTEPYQYLMSLDDSMLAPRAARLRTLLETSKDPWGLRLYSTLWSAEFRLNQDEEKARVAADLRRLREITGIQATIAAGAKLIGDDALAKEMTPPRPFDVFEAQREWRQSHPDPKAGDLPAQKRAFAEAELAVSAHWIVDAPERIAGYSARLSALETLGAPPEEIGKAAEDVVRVALTDDRADGGSFIANIAAMYVRRGIQLDRVPGLIEQALKLFDDPEAVIEIDLAPNHGAAAEGRMRMAQWHVSALVTLSEYDEKVGNLERARSVLAAVPALLEGLSVPQGTRDAGSGHNLLIFHAFAHHDYWKRIAEIDERQGKPQDAVREYREALLYWDGSRDILLARQRQLWKDLGRSDQAWQAWVESIPRPAWKGQAEAPAGFVPVHRALPKVALTDLDGNQWPPERLAKTTVAVVWATWCEPCRRELPFFAKLAERLKDRSDVQVIAFTVDENPETARQFVRQNGYLFPVLSAKNFSEDAMPYFSIPRTWIIRNGVIVQEAEGFSGDGGQWIERAAAQLK